MLRGRGRTPTRPAGVARPFAAAAGVSLAAVLLAGLALGVAVWPAEALAGAVGATALLAARTAHPVLGAATSARRAAFTAAAVPLGAGLVLSVGTYPATTLLATMVVGIGVLAWHSPVHGLGAAVLLFGFEGSVKILLGLERFPLLGNRAMGAAALDLALLAAVIAVLARDRLRAPSSTWASASRLERVVFGLIAAWMALSVVQIVQGGDIGRGLSGFRLFQWYVVVALATLTVFSHPQLRAVATRGVVAIGLVVSLYAAARVLIGPAEAERAFALSVPTVTMYGDSVRAVGSFSSAIGLSSFLAPMAVFTFVLGLLVRRLRAAGWMAAAFAVIGVIGSYSRASLFGVALGLACGLLLMVIASDTPARRKLGAVGLVVAVLAGTYGGLLVASRASPVLHERAEGVIDPLDDPSVRLRFETWRRTLDDAGEHPLGQGIGAVGAASAPSRDQVRTTDNSVLKVLVEQGLPGLGLFVAAIFGAVIILARRFRLAGDPRPVGLAALAGFVTFLGMSFTGETVEQPGKVLAWGFLGMATAYAFVDARRASRSQQ
jgi:O-antigen ligase